MGYDGPTAARLGVVQEQIRHALAETDASPIRVISICAGQGHDIVGALQDFGRADEVEALLVELDERNVGAARQRIADACLSGITVETADAGMTDAYTSIAPAHLILACGVFGSLTDDDIDMTVGLLPSLASPNAQVIWTANRVAPGLWDAVLAAFARHGFRASWTTDDQVDTFGVGRHQLNRRSTALRPGQRMFSFADEETLLRIGRISLPDDS